MMNLAAQLRSPRSSTLFLLSSLLLAPTGSAETYDHWTTAHFTAPEIAAGLASPLCDHDGDLCPNIVEYFGGSLPKDKNSSFATVLSHDEMPGHITVSFPAGTNRFDIEHVVLVSNDLESWTDEAVFICHEEDLTYQLNGYRYVKVGVRPKPGVFIDTDADGLLDFFEESLVTSDLGDSYTSLADILPNEDFDNNGTLNINEAANSTGGGGTFTKPSLVSSNAVSCALDEISPVDPPVLLVHTLLQ